MPDYDPIQLVTNNQPLPFTEFIGPVVSITHSLIENAYEIRNQFNQVVARITSDGKFIGDGSLLTGIGGGASIATNVSYVNTTSGLTAINVQEAIDQLNANLSNNDTKLISGGAVVLRSAYIFDVSASTYYISGVYKVSQQGSITLQSADAALNRFDIIALNNNGVAVSITGVAAANPIVPMIDPNQYLALTIVRVDAGTTTPTTIENVVVYKENVEWTGSTNGSGLNLLSSVSPKSGSMALEGTSVTNASYVSWLAPSPLTSSANDVISFFIRSKAAWPKSKALLVGLYSGATQLGNAIAISGFDSSNTTTYQLVSIPFSSLGVTPGTSFNNLRLTVSGGGGNIGFFIDDVVIQRNPNDISNGDGLSQAEADTRYLQLEKNGADIVSKPTFRTNLDLSIPLHYSWSGSNPTVGVKSDIRHRVEYAAIATHLQVWATGTRTGDFTIRILRSTDGGATFPNVVGTLTLTSVQLHNNITLNTAVAAGNLLCIEVVAVGGVASFGSRLTTVWKGV